MNERAPDHWRANIDDGLKIEDAKIIKRAINHRWDVPDDLRKKLINEVSRRINEDGRDKAIAEFGNLIVKMVESDIKAEELADKIKRLDADKPTDNQGINITIRRVESSDFGEVPDA